MSRHSATQPSRQRRHLFGGSQRRAVGGVRPVLVRVTCIGGVIMAMVGTPRSAGAVPVAGVPTEEMARDVSSGASKSGSSAAAPTREDTKSPASQPDIGPLLRGKSLQPGDKGYKSHAWAAAGSFGGTLLPVLLGGFLTRSQSDAVMWTGVTMIALGQSFGPSVGYWYARERPRFTFHRLGLSALAVAAAGYPIYAYTGRLESYNSAGAAVLTVFAVAAESVTLALAVWDLSLLGETIERHNERPLTTSRLRGGTGGLTAVAPVVFPGGMGMSVAGAF